MAYPIEFRKKVINYIENGGSITEAAETYEVGRTTIYRWLSRENLEPNRVKNRQTKLDWRALEKDIQENPSSRLIDRAQKFGVSINAIFNAIKKMKITRKKLQMRYKERNHKQRIKYYQLLRQLIKEFGSKNLVFIDESGFDRFQPCIYAWSKIGKKVYGERTGKRYKRQNLIAGKRKGKKDLLAPMILEGSVDASTFEYWLSFYLLPSLEMVSILIMDNAPIHRKNTIKELVEAAGHKVIFLPPYSPDLNDIEHDFSALKRARMYAPPDTSLDEIIRNYCVE